MFRLAYQLLLSRKKWLLLIVIVFGVTISSVTSIFTVNNTINTRLLNESFEQYGEFSGVLYNLPYEIGKKTESFGHFVSLDKIMLNKGKSATIGWVDQKFIDLGHLKLISGVFPTNPNEVTIESYYREAIDPKWKIGEARVIKVGISQKSLKLVGIVENYSARWSSLNVRYPNLFIQKPAQLTSSSHNNYLIGYHRNLSKNKNMSMTEYIIKTYNQSGNVNYKLFDNGLKEISNVTNISLGVQLIILIIASFSILCILEFFNLNQMSKFAIFRTLGCTNKKLFIISSSQTMIIYILGIIVSLPLTSLFHYFIMRTTYGYDLLRSNLVDLLFGTFIWLVLLFLLIVSLSYLAIKNLSKRSISANIKGDNRNPIQIKSESTQTQSYSMKQLKIQILSHPKISLFSLITLTSSILVVLFSFTLANEAAGLWNTRIDYFLTSQELIGTKLINHMPVVATKGDTFSSSEVKEIESLEGVKYVDKVPFMIDVIPFLEKDFLSAQLAKDLENQQHTNQYSTSDEVALPNVKYVLVGNQEISRHSPRINDNSVIVYIPGISNEAKAQLVGNHIFLSKTYAEGNAYETQNWDFNIQHVINQPYSIKLDNNYSITNDGITILINENTAINKGLTQGYKDLSIYTEDNLTKETSTNIYNKIYSLASGIQGGLFQYVPKVIHDQTRITDYLKRLGRFAFYISISLAIASIFVVIYGKYQTQKRYWGIYRTLGMSTNKVMHHLFAEAQVFLLLATMISLMIYCSFLYLFGNMTFSIVYYLKFTFLTILSIFFMLIASSLLIRQMIEQDSIAASIRITE